jgi:hypothetical protein
MENYFPFSVADAAVKMKTNFHIKKRTSLISMEMKETTKIRQSD